MNSPLILSLLLFEFGLVVTFLPISLTPAFGQNCLNSYTDENLEENAPFQHVATVRSDRHLDLNWTIPTDFTEIIHFSGKAHQVAEHEGIDFIHSHQSVSQVAVWSVADGKVVYVRRGCPQSSLFEPNTEKRGCGGYWGNHIVILHPNGLFTRYAHLSPDSIQVQVGQKIHQKDEIAKMGNSGLSDMRHLHFELGVAIQLNSCEPAQPLKYVYNPATHLGWLDLLPSSTN